MSAHSRRKLADDFLTPQDREILERMFDIDDPAQFRVHISFVVSVATRTDNPRALADEALILIRPFHNFNVPSTVIHGRDSSSIV